MGESLSPTRLLVQFIPCPYQVKNVPQTPGKAIP